MLHVKYFTFSPFQENTYLLYNDAGEACIVDPGCYDTYEESELADFITAKQLKPLLLLNTHCHPDHIFGLKWAAEKYQLVPHLHAAELPVMERGPMMSEMMWGLPFKNYQGTINWLTEGQTILLGSDLLKVIFAPGHSPGHVCFYCAEQGFVINGDVLFKGGMGRTDLPGGNYDVLVKSIKTQLLTLPDATVIYTGHGTPTTVGHEKPNFIHTP